MGLLFNTIKNLVHNQRYMISEHAVERLDERRILEWQIVAGISNAKVLLERPTDRPHPSIETLLLMEQK